MIDDILNYIISIPGPLFLFYYIGLALIVIVIGSIIIRNDRTRGTLLDDPQITDSSYIAVMAGSISGNIVCSFIPIV